MKLVKRIEGWNKRIIYFFLRFIFRNKKISYPINPAKMKKILLLRYDAIGDMIITTPVIGLLHNNLPDCELHILASHRNRRIIEDDKRLSHVFVYDLSLKSFIKNIRLLRKQKYDAVFSLVFNRTTHAGLISILSAGRNAAKVTLRHDKRENLYSTFFNIQIPADNLRNKYTMAEIQVMMVCQVFGWNYNKSMVKLHVPVPECYYTEIENYLSQYNINSFLVLNISAGNSYRVLSAEKNVQLISEIKALYPELQIVITTAPEDEVKAIEIKRLAGSDIYVFAPSKDILFICALISRASYVISPDTSIVHLAASNRVPVVVMYSRLASFIMEWMPFGVEYRQVVTIDREPIENLNIEDIVKAFEDLYYFVPKSIQSVK